MSALLVIRGAVTEMQAQVFLLEYAAKPQPPREIACRECCTLLTGAAVRLFLVTPQGFGSCLICEACVKAVRAQSGEVQIVEIKAK